MTYHDTETGIGELLANLSDGVLTLTLNRPEARNALTVAMLDALTTQLARAEVSDDVRCVVLTGAGTGFCAGGDIKGMSDPNSGVHPGNAPDLYIHRQRMVQRGTAGKLFDMPKPTLAVINGAAAGAGLSLALACDLRIMADEAALLTAFGRIGLSGDFGGTYFMTHLIGTARARELYLLSDRVPAHRALEIGLVNWTCGSEKLTEESLKIARRLASGPAIAYRYMKENLNRALTAQPGECLDLEATHHVHCMFTADHRDAASAFVEKRDPVFTGN